MKEIQLTQGYVALVDDDDYERVSRLNGVRTIGRKNGKDISLCYNYLCSNKRGLFKIAPLYLGKPEKGLEIDHIEGDGLIIER